MNWEMNPARTEEHRQSVVAKVLAWWKGASKAEPTQSQGVAPVTMGQGVSDALAAMQATMVAKCNHEPSDTGFSFAYCKKCDAKMVMIDMKWEVNVR
jgi:hypothetical protein